MSPCQGEGHEFESRRPLKKIIQGGMPPWAAYIGDVAKWQGKGLQNPEHGFKSHRRLSLTQLPEN